MSTRYDAASDYLNRTASAPQQYPLTVTFWLYITTDRNAYGALFLIANSGGTSFISFNLSSSGTNLQISVNGNTTNGSNLNVGQWYHIACVIASATSQKMYVDGVLDINKTSTSTTFTPAQFFLGSDTVGFLNGRLGDVIITERELTVEEIKTQMNDLWPILYRPWAFYPMFPGSTERTLDYSGNGRNLTANGSLTDEAGPPVWFGNELSAQQPAAVSTAVNVALDALTLTSSVPTLTVTPGAVSIPLDALTLAGAAPTLTVTPGAAQIALDALTLAGSVPVLTVTPGAASVTLDALLLAGSVPSLTVTTGAVSIPLDALALASAAQDLTVTPGAASITLDALTLASAAQTLVVTPGATSVTLDALTAVFSVPDLTVNVSGGAQAVDLDALTLAGSVPSLTVTPGAASIALDALTLASSALTLVVTPGGALVALDSLTLASAINDLSVVPGAASVTLNALVLAGSVANLTVTTGGIATTLDALTLASSILDLTVVLSVNVDGAFLTVQKGGAQVAADPRAQLTAARTDALIGADAAQLIGQKQRQLQ